MKLAENSAKPTCHSHFKLLKRRQLYAANFTSVFIRLNNKLLGFSLPRTGPGQPATHVFRLIHVYRATDVFSVNTCVAVMVR